MDASQDIIRLKQQMEQLSQQLKHCEQEIDLLKRQLEINSLADHKPPVPVVAAEKTPARTAFNIENFIGLRLIHFAGIIVLVLGLSIGVKFAIDQNLVTPLMRILLAYGAGTVLYLLSVRLRKNLESFAAILFSGGMASLYFTTYAAVTYYNLLPLWAAGFFMIAITCFTVFTAGRYKRQEIAVLGLTGAYGIPFLISRNADAALPFLSYILLINAGSIFLAARRSWFFLAGLTFVTTWFLVAGWALTRYNSSEVFTGVGFSVAFYLLFFFYSCLVALHVKTKNNPCLLLYILLNNAALYLCMLLLFNGDDPMAAASSITFLFTCFCCLQSAVLYAWRWQLHLMAQAVLQEAAVALIVFTALQWKGIALTMSWTVIAVLLFASGLVLKKSWPRLFSLLLFSLILLKLAVLDSSRFTTLQKVIAYLILGSLLLAVSFFYQKFKQVFFKNGGQQTL